MREDGQGSKEQQQQNWQERKDRKRESAAMRGEDRAAGEGRWEERVNRTFHEPLTQMRREIDAEIPTENMTFAVLRGALREATLEDREMFSRLQEHATGMNATAEHALANMPDPPVVSYGDQLKMQSPPTGMDALAARFQEQKRQEAEDASAAPPVAPPREDTESRVENIAGGALERLMQERGKSKGDDGMTISF